MQSIVLFRTRNAPLSQRGFGAERAPEPAAQETGRRLAPLLIITYVNVYFALLVYQMIKYVNNEQKADVI